MSSARPVRPSSRRASGARPMTRSSPSSSSRRRPRVIRHWLPRRDDPRHHHPDPRARRQGADRDHPSAGDAGEPDPRTVPDPRAVRSRLPGRPAAGPRRPRPPGRQSVCRPTRRAYAGAADGLIVDQVDDGPGGGRGEASRRARSMRSSSSRPTSRRSSRRASARRSSVEVNMVDPAQVKFANVMAAAARRSRQPEDHRHGGPERARPRTGQSNIPPDVVAAPTDAKLVDIAPASAEPRQLLRARGPGARAPAPVHHARGAVTHPGEDERHPRALPGRPDERLGDRGGQDRVVRGDRRR